MMSPIGNTDFFDFRLNEGRNFTVVKVGQNLRVTRN